MRPNPLLRILQPPLVWLWICVWGLPQGLQACDVCGASMYMGVQPNDRLHRLELLYRFGAYNGYLGIPNSAPQAHTLFKTSHGLQYHADALNYNPNDREFYHRMELRGTWFLTPRWQLFATVPLQAATERINGQTQQQMGLADVSGIVQYYPIWRDSPRQSHQAAVGMGLKAPTGRFSLAAPASATNVLLYPGTGSWDGILTASYQLRYQQFGARISSIYTLNTTNAAGTRICNGLALEPQVYAWIGSDSSRMAWLPSTGLLYEQTAGIEQSSPEGRQLLPATGEQTLFWQFGLTAYWGAQSRWSFRAQYYHPVVRRVSGLQLGNAGRVLAALGFAF